MLILQGSFFSSCLAVASSKPGHQGELSPPCPRHRPGLTSDPHRCSDSRETRRSLEFIPHRLESFARQIMEGFDPCGCSCQFPTSSPFLDALHVFFHEEETLRIRNQAWVTQGVEILRICPLALSLPSRAGKCCPRAIPNPWLWMLPDFMVPLGLLYCPNPSWIWIRSQKALHL